MVRLGRDGLDRNRVREKDLGWAYTAGIPQHIDDI